MIHRVTIAYKYGNILTKGGDILDAQKCGAFVAMLRKKHSLTQTQLASILGVTDKAVSRWETGKGFPDVDSLVKLSNYFDITVNELLLGEHSSEETSDKALLQMCHLRECENRSFKRTLTILAVITILTALLFTFLISLFFYRLNQTEAYPPQVLIQDLLTAESVEVSVDNTLILDNIDFLFVSKLQMEQWVLTNREKIDEKALPVAIVTTKGDNKITVHLFENYARATLENYAAEHFVGTYAYPDNMILSKELLLGTKERMILQ